MLFLVIPYGILYCSFGGLTQNVFLCNLVLFKVRNSEQRKLSAKILLILFPVLSQHYQMTYIIGLENITKDYWEIYCIWGRKILAIADDKEFIYYLKYI